ncbi:MAG: hypothetical protein HFG71_04920 [Hungatella sp.]|jgi:hypothetical protein|nr:hypothetical protein [Hungatella sp.]
MSNYSYSKELNINKVTFREFDLNDIREIFTKIFESYNPKVKTEVFDSFCEDFYNLTTQIHASSEKIWRMIITDMLFCYEDKGYLEGAAKDSGVKRKQFAIIATVLLGKLRA